MYAIPLGSPSSTREKTINNRFGLQRFTALNIQNRTLAGEFPQQCLEKNLMSVSMISAASPQSLKIVLWSFLLKILLKTTSWSQRYKPLNPVCTSLFCVTNLHLKSNFDYVSNIQKGNKLSPFCVFITYLLEYAKPFVHSVSRKVFDLYKGIYAMFEKYEFYFCYS